MIIGISGKSGVGKTTLAKTLFEGWEIISVDDVAHQVLAQDDVKKNIRDKFGIDYSELNRVELGDLIFGNRHKMKELADIIWEKMQKVIDSRVKTGNNIVIDWILLPHSHYFKMCDLNVLVKAVSENERVSHVLARDNIEPNYLAKRDANGIEYDESQFDYIIINNYNKKERKVGYENIS